MDDAASVDTTCSSTQAESESQLAISLPLAELTPVSSEKRKRSNNSAIWEYFDKEDWETSSRTAICKAKNCMNNRIKCPLDGSTGPLWRYLQRYHDNLYLHATPPHKRLCTEEPTIPTLSFNKFQQSRVNAAFTAWIIEEVLPFRSFETARAKKAFQSIDPRCSGITGNGIKYRIKKLYSKSVEYVKVCSIFIALKYIITEVFVLLIEDFSSIIKDVSSNR